MAESGLIGYWSRARFFTALFLSFPKTWSLEKFLMQLQVKIVLILERVIVEEIFAVIAKTTEVGPSTLSYRVSS